MVRTTSETLGSLARGYRELLGMGSAEAARKGEDHRGNSFSSLQSVTRATRGPVWYPA
jgi:hypothetical protein